MVGDPACVWVGGGMSGVGGEDEEEERKRKSSRKEKALHQNNKSTYDLHLCKIIRGMEKN